MSVKNLFENYFEEYIEHYPTMATFIGINKYNHMYPNYYSDQEILKSKNFDKKYLGLIVKAEKKKLSLRDTHHLKVLKSRILSNLDSYKYEFHLLPLDQFNNFIINYLDMASGLSYLPLKTKKDFNNLIIKTTNFFELIDTTICRMREGISRNLVFSKIIMEKTLKQLKNVIKTKDYLVEDKKIPADLKKKYYEVLDKQFTKKIKKVIKFLENDYIPKCSNDLKYPGGPKVYKYLVKKYTTLKNPSIPNIHKLGLTEVERINKEINKLFKSNDMIKPTNNNLRTMTFKTKSNVLKDYERVRNIINKKLIPKYFNVKISHDYLLKKVPTFKEENDAGAYYMMCSIDNKRKGTFFLNLGKVEDHQTYSTFSLSLHEGNPGHHFQLTLANDLNLPNFVTYCDDEISYVEGWALYAESLAHDFLKDSTDKKDIMYRFGCYNYEMMRACRLVVDTGIHYYGWNFKKCFDFMKKYTTFSNNEIETEIYRYVVYAGQALSYKIGELKFKELREYYLKNKKGTIKDFHKKVLEMGSCSMELLEKMIKK
tara:strand:+ start:5652 stop:7271 length:1620 start_codon:yes stop_codon:yes gene_type:complete